MRTIFLLLALLAAAPAIAATATAPAASSGLFQVLFGLIAVLGLMGGAAWLLKRIGGARVAGNNTVRIVGGVSVGTRERVIVVEIADQWIVVGVAQGQVNALATLPRQEAAPSSDTTANGAPNFASWLKKTMDKRNGN